MVKSYDRLCSLTMPGNQSMRKRNYESKLDGERDEFLKDILSQDMLRE